MSARAIVCRTERLVLREIDQADFPAIHAYSSDYETTYYLGWGPNDAATTRSFMDAWFTLHAQTPRRDYDLAVCKTDGTFLGAVWVNIDENLKTGAVGWIISRRYQRRGYASEAAAALLAYCFVQLKLHRVYARCDPDNTASYKVMERIGMCREGRSRESTMIHGLWRDELLYGILEKDWEQNHSEALHR